MWAAQWIDALKVLAVGPRKIISVCSGQGNFENHCNKREIVIASQTIAKCIGIKE
jgi:hypothetical protein